MSMTFNGTIPDFVTMTEKRTPYKAPVTWGTVVSPGRPGAIPINKQVDPIVIPVVFLVEGKTHEEYLRNTEKFSAWLKTEKPESLIFDDDPNRTYYALAQGDFFPKEELVLYGIIEVGFFCPYPYKFGPEKTEPFVNGAAVIHNTGIEPVGPFIRAEALGDITHLDIFNESKYMRIGKPPEQGVTPVEAETRVMDNSLSSMTGWTYGGLSVDGGEAVGSFTTDAGNMFPNDYGTGGTYHGPAVKQAIPEAPLTDWRVEFKLEFPTPRGKYGRAECYLLDDQGNHIGKLAIKSRYHNPNVTIEIRIGGGSNYTFLVNKEGLSNGTEWNNFDGLIQLSKKGNLYEFYIAQISITTGRHSYAYAGSYRDEGNQYFGNLSQVQLHVATWGQQEPLGARLADLEIYRYNDVPETDPRVIARQGDVFEVDFANSAIYLNGAERKDLKDISARFFKVPVGTHALLLEPNESFNATASIREEFS